MYSSTEHGESGAYDQNKAPRKSTDTGPELVDNVPSKEKVEHVEVAVEEEKRSVQVSVQRAFTQETTPEPPIIEFPRETDDFETQHEIEQIEYKRDQRAYAHDFSQRGLKHGRRNFIHNKTRYKTEICRTYAHTGQCGYGNRCQFAHGTGDLRPRNFGTKYKTEKCRSFAKEGNCPFGKRCAFLHDELRMEYADNTFWLLSPAENLVRVEIVSDSKRKEQLKQLIEQQLQDMTANNTLDRLEKALELMQAHKDSIKSQAYPQLYYPSPQQNLAPALQQLVAPQLSNNGDMGLVGMPYGQSFPQQVMPYYGAEQVDMNVYSQQQGAPQYYYDEGSQQYFMQQQQPVQMMYNQQQYHQQACLHFHQPQEPVYAHRPEARYEDDAEKPK